jgi:hypothetical protein
VDAANTYFLRAGVDKSRFEFVVGDALQTLSEREIRVDTAFVLGLFYHLDYHINLMGKLWETGAQSMIVDTLTSPDRNKVDRFNNTIAFIRENTAPNENAANEIYPGARLSIVGYPSRNFMRMAFGAFGFSFEEVEWIQPLRRWGNEGLGDYEDHSRGTFVANRSDAVPQTPDVPVPQAAAPSMLRGLFAGVLRRAASRIDRRVLDEGN